MGPWSRGREVVRGVLRSSLKPEKGLLLPSERDGDFLSPVFYTAASKCVCITRLVGARHLSPVVLWTMWPEGGSEPLTSARSDFTAQSLDLSIDVCPGLGISPFEQTFGWDFLRPIFAQDRPRNYFLGGIWIFWNFFFEDLCSSRAVQESFGGYLWNSNFLWKHRVSIVTGLSDPKSWFPSSILRDHFLSVFSRVIRIALLVYTLPGWGSIFSRRFFAHFSLPKSRPYFCFILLTMNTPPPLKKKRAPGTVTTVAVAVLVVVSFYSEEAPPRFSDRKSHNWVVKTPASTASWLQLDQVVA